MSRILKNRTIRCLLNRKLGRSRRLKRSKRPKKRQGFKLRRRKRLSRKSRMPKKLKKLRIRRVSPMMRSLKPQKRR